MTLRYWMCQATLVLGSAGVLLAAPTSPADPSAPSLTSDLLITSPTQVPGEQLKPGKYTITVVDHLSDRVVLRIDSTKEKVHDTFLGVSNLSLAHGSTPGAVFWSAAAGLNQAMRGFAFPGGSAVEFVYPKDEAVALAKANGGKVPAIDPASEGMVAKDNTLSKDDMAMVTLWTLSPTTVGAGDSAQPSIQAEHYHAAPQPPPPSMQEVAQNEPPPPPAAHPSEQTPHHRAVVGKLPHTASELPLVMLLGLLSLLLVSVLEIGRRVYDAR